MAKKDGKAAKGKKLNEKELKAKERANKKAQKEKEAKKGAKAKAKGGKAEKGAKKGKAAKGGKASKSEAPLLKSLMIQNGFLVIKSSEGPAKYDLSKVSIQFAAEAVSKKSKASAESA